MRILAFERGWWRFPGAKEREILEVFGIPATRYYQLLNELIDRPEAAQFDPALVARLRRQRGPAPPDALRAARRPARLAACPIPRTVQLAPAGQPRRRRCRCPATPAGRAGLAALLAARAGALIGVDFDGTLSPIVPDPGDARALPAATAALRRAGRPGRHAGRHHRPPRA